MKPLFSKEGLRRLDEIVKPGVLCAFDFDGTLSPIVTKPEQAFLPVDVLQRLLSISHYSLIAIISGRYLEDLRLRLRFQPHFTLGNHGIEGLPGWERRSGEYEAICSAWSRTLAHALQDNGRFEPTIWVENKRYSLTVHYRSSANRMQIEHALTELVFGLQPEPRVIAGKWSFSQLPHTAVNKGQALQQLMRISGAPSAFYVGDDMTDEDVFRLKDPTYCRCASAF